MYISLIHSQGGFDSMMHSWIYRPVLSREIFRSAAGCVIALSEMKSHDESNPQDPSFTYRGIVSLPSLRGLLLHLCQEGHGLCIAAENFRMQSEILLVQLIQVRYQASRQYSLTICRQQAPDVYYIVLKEFRLLRSLCHSQKLRYLDGSTTYFE